jgi:hypothetical protein
VHLRVEQVPAPAEDLPGVDESPLDSSSWVMKFADPGVKSAGSNSATLVSESLLMSYCQILAR